MFIFEISNVYIVWLVTQFNVFVVYFIQMGGECGTKSLVIIKSDLGLMTNTDVEAGAGSKTCRRVV
jgi:hypothetical protein